MKKAAAISIVLITLTLCAWFLVHMLRKEGGQAARGAMELVKQALNITPEVTVTSYVTRQKTTDTFELASVKKEFPVQYHYEHKQYGSTKRLELVGQYTVKAGFDLRERFSLQVDQKSGRVRADFPAPKILSVQQDGYKVVNDESGYWNRLNQKDQETAVNDMNRKARETALQLQVCQQAKDALRRQLLELARKAGQHWEITFRDEPQLLVPEEPQAR